MGQPAQKSGGSRFKVKRVLRKGSHFVCGMCGSQHTAGKTAVACLEKCVGQYLNQQPVTAIHRNGRNVYACKFCKREHDQEAAASACAKACQAKLTKTANKEQDIARKKLSGVTLAQPPEPEAPGGNEAGGAAAGNPQGAATGIPGMGGHAPGAAAFAAQRRGPQAQRQAPQPPRRNPAILANEPAIEDIMRKHPAGTNGMPSVDSDGASAPAEGPDANEPTVGGDAAAAAPRAKRPKVPDNKKFRRDGARYICRDCKEKFFTRNEVIACYDSHDEE